MRYRCANCDDYNVCEVCEKLDDAHFRDHVFLVFREPAPAPPGSNPKALVRIRAPDLYTPEQLPSGPHLGQSPSQESLRRGAAQGPLARSHSQRNLGRVRSFHEDSTPGQLTGLARTRSYMKAHSRRSSRLIAAPTLGAVRPMRSLFGLLAELLAQGKVHTELFMLSCKVLAQLAGACVAEQTSVDIFASMHLSEFLTSTAACEDAWVRSSVLELFEALLNLAEPPAKVVMRWRRELLCRATGILPEVMEAARKTRLLEVQFLLELSIIAAEGYAAHIMPEAASLSPKRQGESPLNSPIPGSPTSKVRGLKVPLSVATGRDGGNASRPQSPSPTKSGISGVIAAIKASTEAAEEAHPCAVVHEPCCIVSPVLPVPPCLLPASQCSSHASAHPDVWFRMRTIPSRPIVRSLGP